MIDDVSRTRHVSSLQEDRCVSLSIGDNPLKEKHDRGALARAIDLVSKALGEYMTSPYDRVERLQG